jgi:tetraacyldisaccharide 4'-kinase
MYHDGMHPADVWYGQSAGARLARAALLPGSWLYGLGWQSYLTVYRLGLKRPAEPHVPVICVGNLVAGGSGKTPTALAVADALTALGRRVILSMSGYGAPHAEAASMAPEGELDAAEWGDEPAMVRWLRPELPLIVGRRRVLAAELAHTRDPGAVLLMDDGFQHLPLRKHIGLLIDPAPDNRACLPAGPYREPWSNRGRADLVFGDEFQIARSALRFVDSNLQPKDAPTGATALCALGSPAGFLKSLAESGVKVVAERLLPDHDTLTAGTLFDGIDLSIPLVVTAKDWVKLKRRTDLGDLNAVIALQDVSVEPEAPFAEWLRGRLARFENP